MRTFYGAKNWFGRNIIESRYLLSYKVAAVVVVLYLALVVTGDVLIYKKGLTNFFTQTVEQVFPYPAGFVNGDLISLRRFRQEVAARQAVADRQKINTSRKDIERLVINQLVNRALYRQVLEKEKITISEESVDKKLESIYQEAGGKEKLIQFVKENYGGALSLADFRQSIRESLEEAAVRQTLLMQATVRHILVALPEGASESQASASKRKAEEIRAKITNLDQFGEMAKQYSEDLNSRDKGGELGSTPRGNDQPVFSQEFEDTIFSLNLGEISQPVRSQYGWHILVVDKREGKTNASLKEYTLQLRAGSRIRSFVAN